MEVLVVGLLVFIVCLVVLDSFLLSRVRWLKRGNMDLMDELDNIRRETLRDFDILGKEQGKVVNGLVRDLEVLRSENDLLKAELRVLGVVDTSVNEVFDGKVKRPKLGEDEVDFPFDTSEGSYGKRKFCPLCYMPGDVPAVRSGEAECILPEECDKCKDKLKK